MKYAGAILTILVILVSGCSKPSPDEYLERGRTAYEKAQKAIDSLGRSAKVDELLREPLKIYTDLRNTYPGTPQAGEALFMLATIRNNNLHDIPKAVDLYRQYVSEYPEGTKTPVAMFMMAYLYNNELHNLDSAGAWYRRFLERFPNHELALSAQFELSSLGKTPEELLPHDEVAVSKDAKQSKTKQRPQK